MDSDGKQSVTESGFLFSLARDIDVHIFYASSFFGDRTSLLRRLGIFLTPGMLCNLLYRASHWLWKHQFCNLARLVAWFNFLMHKAAICPASSIGPGLYIPHTVGIIFCGHAGERLTLYSNAIVAPYTPSNLGTQVNETCPVLGDGVSIGAFGIVLGGIVIGNGVKIGPGAVICNNVEAGSRVFSKDHVRHALHQSPTLFPIGGLHDANTNIKQH